MRRVRVNCEEPEAAAISEACLALRDGAVIAFPTDTLYGLAVDPLNLSARARLAEIKGRSELKPPPFLVADIDMLSQIAKTPLTDSASRVCDELWPGAITIVVQGASGWDWKAENGTVGVRLPDSSCARTLTRAMGYPLPATSANLSGSLGVILSADDVVRELDGRGVDLLLDGGELPVSSGSTVVTFKADGNWAVLRVGDVSVASIENAIGGQHG